MTVFGQIIDQLVDLLDNGIERVFISRDQHPGGEGARPLLVERVKGEIDHIARIAFTGPALEHRLADCLADSLCKICRQSALQSRGRAKMMQQIGMGSPNPGRDCFQRHRLGAKFNQKLPRGLQSRGSALFWRKALSRY